MDKIDDFIEDIEEITNNENERIVSTDNYTSYNTYGEEDSLFPTRNSAVPGTEIFKINPYSKTHQSIKHRKFLQNSNNNKAGVINPYMQAAVNVIFTQISIKYGINRFG